jgi:hypothetical protein
VSKTLTFIFSGSIYTYGYTINNGFAQVGTNFLIAPKINSSPYIIGININTGSGVAIGISGYTFVASEYAGMSIAVNANSTIAVLSPRQTDYALKFRITYTATSIDFTFIDKIPNTKVIYQESATFFLPDKSRS